MNDPTPPLFTWRWKAAFEIDHADDFVPVKISRGAPASLPGELIRSLARVKALEPAVMLQECGDGDAGWAEFKRLYVDQLEEFGVDLIRRQIHSIAHHTDLPLVLLCHCRCRANCHRGLFAQFWEQQTGQEVHEWDPQLHRPEPEPENVQECLL